MRKPCQSTCRACSSRGRSASAAIHRQSVLRGCCSRFGPRCKAAGPTPQSCAPTHATAPSPPPRHPPRHLTHHSMPSNMISNTPAHVAFTRGIMPHLLHRERAIAHLLAVAVGVDVLLQAAMLRGAVRVRQEHRGCCGHASAVAVVQQVCRDLAVRTLTWQHAAPHARRHECKASR